MAFPESPLSASQLKNLLASNGRGLKRFLKRSNLIPTLQDARRASDKARGLDNTIHALEDIAAENNLNTESTYAEAVFGGTPYAQRHLSATRLVPEYFTEAYGTIVGKRIRRPSNLDHWRTHDIFNSPLGDNFILRGTTLADIEQMSLGVDRLKPGDIARINRMFYTGFLFYRNNPEYDLIRELMVHLAAQKFARPEDHPATPKELMPLDNRLTAYFQYYTNLLLKQSFSSSEGDNMLQSLDKASPLLLRALGCFIPARLGITPSSAIKLYAQKGLSLPWIYRQRWGRHERVLGSESKFAVKPGRLPEDLDAFQYFNPEMDKRAQSELRPYIEGGGGVEFDQGSSTDTLTKLLDQLDLYKPAFYRSAMRSRQRLNSGAASLEVSLPENFPASRMVVTAQYPQTMMLILQFGSGTHLTLEMGEEHRLFGLPPKLEHDNPRLAERLLLKILPSLVSGLKLAYPAIQREVIAPSVVSPKPSAGITPVDGVKKAKIEAYQPPVKEKSARRIPTTILTPLATYLAGPIPAPVSEPEERMFTISYSRTEIASRLPRNTPDRIIDQIMEDMQDVEYGRGDFKKFPDLDLYEARSGNFRIVFTLGKNKTLHVEGIVDRKNLNKLMASLKR